MSTAAVPQAQADYFITPDAYWQFSEAGAPYADSVAQPGNTNNAENVPFGGTNPFTTNPTADASGLVTNGVAFGGTSGLWVLHNAADEVWDWAADANFAIEVWMKRDPSVAGLTNDFDTEVLVGRNDAGSSNVHWFIGLRYNAATGARVVAQLKDADNVGSTLTLNENNTSATNVIDNNWHQVVLVRDALASKVLLYVDGQLEDQSGTITYTGGFAASVASLDFGWLGISGSDQTDFAFNGSIDQVALYGQALTAGEVDQIYQIGHSGKALNEAFAPIYPTGTTDLGISAVGYQVSVSAIPAANPAPTTYSLEAGAPAGMVVDNSGLVTWMPNSTQTGVVNFSVTATNTEGSGTADYAIEIVDPCADLDAYWHLEEDGSGASAGDAVYASSVGTGLTGQCAAGGCPTQDTTTGKVNNAQIFDGTGPTGIDVPAVATADQVFDWTAADSFTIEFWMNRPAGGLASQFDTEVLTGRADGSSTVFWFIGVRNVDGSNVRIYANLVDSDNNNLELANAAGGTNVTDGNWHHVALVRDVLANETRLYVDGALEASDNTVTFTGTFASATAALNIGYLNLGSPDFGLNGSLDELAMYASVLDAEVIAQHATENPGRGYCNSNPSITTAAVTTADPTQDYTYDADAADADGDSVTWSLTTYPAGMTIDSNTGVVSWAQSDVAAAASTSVDVEIHATDSYGGVGIQTYTIAVAAAPATLPQITGQVSLSTTSGAALEIKLTDLTITYTGSGQLTLTVMDGTNYTRSGNTITPDASYTGTLTVPVKVNDGTLDSNTYGLQVTVTAAGSSPGTTGGGGGGGGCFIESSRATDSFGTLKGFGILLISLMALVSATALGGRKNRIE